VGPSIGLDAVKERKSLVPVRDGTPEVQPGALTAEISR
jgi:hypothetical protein